MRARDTLLTFVFAAASLAGTAGAQTPKSSPLKNNLTNATNPSPVTLLYRPGKEFNQQEFEYPSPQENLARHNLIKAFFAELEASNHGDFNKDGAICRYNAETGILSAEYPDAAPILLQKGDTPGTFRLTSSNEYPGFHAQITQEFSEDGIVRSALLTYTAYKDREREEKNIRYDQRGKPMAISGKISGHSDIGAARNHETARQDLALPWDAEYAEESEESFAGESRYEISSAYFYEYNEKGRQALKWEETIRSDSDFHLKISNQFLPDRKIELEESSRTYGISQNEQKQEKNLSHVFSQKRTEKTANDVKLSEEENTQRQYYEGDSEFIRSKAIYTNNGAIRNFEEKRVRTDSKGHKEETNTMEISHVRPINANDAIPDDIENIIERQITVERKTPPEITERDTDYEGKKYTITESSEYNLTERTVILRKDQSGKAQAWKTTYQETDNSDFTGSPNAAFDTDTLEGKSRNSVTRTEEVWLTRNGEYNGWSSALEETDKQYYEINGPRTKGKIDETRIKKNTINYSQTSYGSIESLNEVQDFNEKTKVEITQVVKKDPQGLVISSEQTVKATDRDGSEHVYENRMNSEGKWVDRNEPDPPAQQTGPVPGKTF